MTDVVDIANVLKESLSKSPSHSLTGHQLKLFVTSRYPDFDAAAYSCKNLREFIRRLVPDILELGKSGMDLRYGIDLASSSSAPKIASAVSLSAPPIDSPAEIAAPQEKPAVQHSTPSPLRILLTNPRVWKTFASPTSPYRIFVHDATGQIRVLGTFDQSPGLDWKVVAPISGDTLLEIAKEFVADLPSDQQAALTETMAKPKWWLPFFEVLQTLGLRTKWVAFRRRRIAEEFERAVSQAPLSDKVSRVYVPQPERDEQTLPKRLALSAIRRMSEAELRLLQIPFGHVLDALNEYMGADEREPDLRRRLL